MAHGNGNMDEKSNQDEIRDIKQVPPPAQYVNYMAVRHSAEEFYFEFGQTIPRVEAALMLTRLVTTPEHAKRMLVALKENLEKYEKRFGGIRGKRAAPDAQSGRKKK